MDNASLRRGQACIHLIFDEAMAVLVGDSLLTEACQLLVKNQILVRENLAALLIEAAGQKKMIAGQVADLNYFQDNYDLTSINIINEGKTSALIMASIIGGIRLAKLLLQDESKQDESNEDKSNLSSLDEKLEKLSLKLGLLYQFQDDFLDLKGNKIENTGKDVGLDQINGKKNVVNLLGEEASLKLIEKTKKEINCILDSIFGAIEKNDLKDYIQELFARKIKR